MSTTSHRHRIELHFHAEGCINRSRSYASSMGVLWLGTKEVAAGLGIHPDTLARWRETSEFRFPDPDLQLSRSPGWREATIRVWARRERRDWNPPPWIK